MEYQNYLMHFNPNHDPRNGQFSKKSGGVTAPKIKRKEGESGWRGLMRATTAKSLKFSKKMQASGKKIGQNLRSERGKRVLKYAAVGAALDVGMRFLTRRVGIQIQSAIREGVFPVPDMAAVRQLHDMAHTPVSVNAIAIGAGTSALRTALYTAGLMKIKDIIKARKEKKARNQNDKT